MSLKKSYLHSTIHFLLKPTYRIEKESAHAVFVDHVIQNGVLFHYDLFLFPSHFPSVRRKMVR